MGSAVHKPQIRTSATSRTSPAGSSPFSSSRPPVGRGSWAARLHRCDLPRRVHVLGARDGQRRLRVPLQRTVGRLPFRRARALGEPSREASRGELARACHPPCSARFGGDLSTVDDAQEPSDLAARYRFQGIQEAFDSPRYFVAYRRWLEVGDPPLTSLTRSRLRSLPTPLVSRRSTSQGG
jgi:hypothetical protein